MSNKICLLFLVLAVFGTSCATRCKKFISRSYNYDPYYTLKNESNMMKKPNSDLEMHLSIQAPSDGHIILSPTLNPDPFTGAAYEIVIGSYNNTLTEVRKARHGERIAVVNTPGILSANELRSFYIKISQEGVIEVGRESALPLIRYLVAEPIEVKFYSFSSWKDQEARFLYDCPRTMTPCIPTM